jgi:predicted nucleotidyltransferase
MSKANAIEAAENLQLVIADVVGDTAVRLAYLYGSVAQGYATPESDVDIALVVDPAVLAFMDGYARLVLETDIALALEKRCNLPDVGVRIINDAPVMVQGAIVQKGVLLYATGTQFRVGYEVDALKRSLDYRPIVDRHQAACFARYSSRRVSDRREQTLIDRRRVEDILRHPDLCVRGREHCLL